MAIIQLTQGMADQELIETQNSNNNYLNADKISASEKGVANGVGGLGANGALPIVQGGTGAKAAAEAVINLGALSHYGTQTISRVTNSTDDGAAAFGFRPKLVHIHAVINATNCDLYDSDGSYDGTNTNCIWKYGSAGIAPNRSTSAVVMLHSGNTGQSATCTFTDTGVYFRWTTFGAGLPAGTIYIKIDAIG